MERDEQNQQFQARNEQAKLVQKEARDRLRGKMILEPLPQSFTKHAGIKAGFSTCARTQTDHTPIELSDAMVQTSPVVVLMTDQFKALKDSGTVPDSPGVPAVPPVDSDVLDPLSEPVFEVQSLGRKMKLTNREIRVRKMSDPELKRAKVSINCSKGRHFELELEGESVNPSEIAGIIPQQHISKRSPAGRTSWTQNK